MPKGTIRKDRIHISIATLYYVNKYNSTFAPDINDTHVRESSHTYSYFTSLSIQTQKKRHFSNMTRTVHILIVGINLEEENYASLEYPKYNGITIVDEVAARELILKLIN